MSFLIDLKDRLKVSPLGVAFMTFRRNHIYRGKKKAYAMMKKYGCGDLPEEKKQAMFRDMETCSRKYGFNYAEYFLYHLADRDDAQRRSFISDSEHVTICEAFNQPKNQKIFDDKSLTAQRFARFYQRDTLVVRSMADADKLAAFLKRYHKAIVKPLSDAGGHGIRIAEDGDDVQRLIETYCGGMAEGAIVEELIVQDPRMAVLHPESVNTVRVPAVRLNDRTEIIQTFFRVGRGDKVVDNGGSGGIVCAVDPQTGIVIAAGDGAGCSYEVHPETGVQLVGFQVPEWEKALALVRELVEVVPDNRYTGWDLALTEKGWVMVEGNARGQWRLRQSVSQQGARPEVERCLRDAGIQYRSRYQ